MKHQTRSDCALSGLYCSGYVHQKELFFQHLTVREHLTFHAVNRLSCLKSIRECEERVSEVIEEVDLTRVADNKIGGGAFYITKGKGYNKTIALLSLDSRSLMLAFYTYQVYLVASANG